MAPRTRPGRATVSKTQSQPAASSTTRARASKGKPLVVNQNPYYLPTESEIFNAKYIIHGEETALRKVEGALTRGQEAFDASIMAICKRHRAQVAKMTAEWSQTQTELETQVKEIEARLKRQREFLAPVKWLPSEVLNEIFMIHVDGGGTPWTLLRVCRLWKAVIFSTPHVWRYIQITHSGQDYWRFDSGTSFQMCFTNAHFERALSRTAAAPLSISITRPLHIQDVVADSDRLFALFGTLTKVLNRCDTIQLKGIPQSFSTRYQELFATLEFPISSSLRCLRVGYGWGHCIFAQKLLAASNHERSALRELSMEASGNSYLVYSLTNHRILLNRLTSFSANGFEVPAEVFASMHCLSYFSQSGNRLSLPRATSVSNLLQEAQFLDVGLDVTIDGTFQFGNLRKLVLRSCFMHAGIIQLPVLDTLIFEGWSWLPILRLDCPLVSHLELEGGPYSSTNAKEEVDRIWGPGERFARLKFLKINLVMSDAVLITILRKAVALEHLFITSPDTMRPAVPGDTFFKSLLIENSHCLGFLRNLHTLILESDPDYFRSRRVLARLRIGFKRVVRSRQRYIPLRNAIFQALKRGWDGVPTLIKEEYVVCEEEE